MTRELTLRSLDIPSIRKFGVGFDTIFNELSQLTNQANVNYPPYNIIKYTEDKYAIELAVAGFKEGSISVTLEKNILTIKGEQEEAREEGVEYIHRGIGLRSFTRNFTLAEHVEVVDAHYKNGILTINLERIIPEDKLPRKIEITY
jgi:molecular chaperone IbpA